MCSRCRSGVLVGRQRRDSGEWRGWAAAGSRSPWLALAGAPAPMHPGACLAPPALPKKVGVGWLVSDGVRWLVFGDGGVGHTAAAASTLPRRGAVQSSDAELALQPHKLEQLLGLLQLACLAPYLLLHGNGHPRGIQCGRGKHMGVTMVLSHNVAGTQQLGSCWQVLHPVLGSAFAVVVQGVAGCERRSWTTLVRCWCAVFTQA